MKRLWRKFAAWLWREDDQPKFNAARDRLDEIRRGGL